VGSDWSFSYTIFPGSPVTFRFPQPVERIILGNSEKFVAQVIGEDTVTLKAKTTQTGLYTGLQVQFRNQQIVSLRLKTGDLESAVDEVSFYKGSSPWSGELEKERKGLQAEYAEKAKALEKESAARSEKALVTSIWDHFDEEKLTAGHKEHGVLLEPKRWLEFGSNGIVTLEVTNDRKEPLALDTLELRSFFFRGFLNLKREKPAPVAARRYCEVEVVEPGKKTRCGFALDLTALPPKHKRLTVQLLLPEGKTVEVLLPAVQWRAPEKS